jgi:hypothetical protein
VTGPVPGADEADQLRRDAQATIDAYKAFLDSPAFQHSIDVAVLVKIAGDDKADIRERRRAAEVLAKLRLQAMEGLAELLGAREQVLDRLGIRPAAQSLALTQINQRIEIVRARDWRAAAPLEEGADVEAEVLPEPATPAPARNGHELNRDEHVHGEDPPS